MAIDRQAPAAGRTSTEARQAIPGRQALALAGGGVSGNRLLTAQTGAALVVMLFVLGITILRVRQLLSVHMFVGMLLIPPIALKLASTGYRFARYYASEPRYREAGPPAPLLRAIAPVVVISTVAVFGTGIALLAVGPRSSLQGALLSLHKATFIVWLLFTAVHVLGHLAELPGALRARSQGALAGAVGEVVGSLPGMRRGAGAQELSAADARGAGRAGRVMSLAGALVAGLVLAVVSISWYGPWLHSAASLVDR